MSELLGNYFIGNGEVMDASAFIHFHGLTEKAPSIYEVVRIEEGIPLFFEDYMLRLTNSFRLLRRPLPIRVDTIAAAVAELVRVNDHPSGPVKLVFGAGDTRFFIAFLMRPHLPRPDEYIRGVKTVFMRETRETPNLKLWNRGLRDRSEELLSSSGAYEAILVNTSGYITEASRSNVFFIKGEEIFTTGDEHILPGITRKKVLEVCDIHNIPVHITSLPADKVEHYDSCFLTGTARKIVPVRDMGDVSFNVNTPVLRAVSNHFEAFVNDYLRAHR